MPLADELEALRAAGRVKQTSTRLSADVEKNGIIVTSPEQEAKRRKEKEERQRQSLMDAQNAMHEGAKGAGLGDVNLLYERLIAQQREKKAEAEKNLHEWRKQHSGRAKDGEGNEMMPVPDRVANKEALEMLPEHVVAALKAKYETEDGAAALSRALQEESEHGGKGDLAKLLELPDSPVKGEKPIDETDPKEEAKDDPKEIEPKEEAKEEPKPKDATPSELRIEHTRRFYNAYTQPYIDNVASPALTPAARRDAFVSHVQLQQNLNAEDPVTIIDLGCGHGRDALHFSSLGHRVLGVDFSIEMLKRASRLAPKAHYINRDMRSLREVLVDESVDGIWANASLGHLPKEDAKGVLTGLYAKVRPGGVLCLSLRKGSEDQRGEEGEEFGIDERYAALEEDVAPEEDSRRKLYSYYTNEEVRELLVAAGWEAMTETGEDDLTSEGGDYATHPLLYAYAVRRKEDGEE
ncbi:hypothetical protein ACHAXT_005719 [Thalassiosira profunda]